MAGSTRRANEEETPTWALGQVGVWGVKPARLAPPGRPHYLVWPTFLMTSAVAASIFRVHSPVVMSSSASKGLKPP